MSTTIITAEDAAVDIRASAVTRVLPFAAVTDIRYYLRGVAVIPIPGEGVVAAATDGHALLVARDRDGHADRPVILPLNKRDHGRHLKQGGSVRVAVDGTTYVTDEDRAVYISPDHLIEGQFPDIQRMLASAASWQPGIPDCTLALPLLQRVQGVAGKHAGVRFYHHPGDAGTSAVLFTIGQDLFGLVMPMRDDGANEALRLALPLQWRPASLPPVDDVLEVEHTTTPAMEHDQC